MITIENFKQALLNLGFTEKNNVLTKSFDQKYELKADFTKKELIFPAEIVINDKTTSNFSQNENFVVFECVCRLLDQGYSPAHLELEKKWSLGHSQKSGKADICVKDNDGNILLIIECKTAGQEYKKAINILENDARNQLFSYLQQASSTQFLALYASDFVDNNVQYDYYLINVQDNDELLKTNKTLFSFKEATTAEAKWQVWHDTYDQEHATLGIFEESQAYKIGKNKITLKDLSEINSKDIQGKYHEFATILRQHNVSGRENAFDKLVNLFLCKITDEMENPTELKFYWKGRAYDNPFDFQDRLQALYQQGMEKFLGDKITYVADAQIDDAFKIFAENSCVAKDQIKDFVRQLKFFSNNDFAFIDVHNEKLFYQNFAVLLKIAQMIQDIKLTESEENQFLGDMFEGFLDQGVKQSEGQFFTPMPIVKFIINSLPNKEKPKVIDYACGAGHFLNEYAKQNAESKVFGVEKEYRLSKVAKVSGFMYGQNIDIIYNDALQRHDKLEDHSFDVLIANPPYSVKGFLTTLKEEDRNTFELISEVETKSYSKTGAIECFFIERAKQLLKTGAVAGIIVPSSILNKDTPKIYTRTREIILKYFDIIAIAELGSGTFGKTGTNTVTLFLRKKAEDKAKHYHNMVSAWFKGEFNSNEQYKDNHFLEQYCQHIECPFEHYKAFLTGTLVPELFKQETFAEYEKAFNKNYKEPTSKEFKGKTKEQKATIKQAEFIKFMQELEFEKLYFFCLAYAQKAPCVIVKSPTENAKVKKFLGYEWSGRKGSEGIKYLAQQNLQIDAESEELEEDDKRVLENMFGLQSIFTPLYNPQNSDDESKINKIIKDNFNGLQTTINEDLKEFVSLAKVTTMLDFSRVEFNKALNLMPAKKVEIESKYPLEKLGYKITEREKSKIKVGNAKENLNGKYPFFTSGENIYRFDEYLVDDENIFLSTGGNAVIKYFDGKASYSTDTFVISSKDPKEIKTKYIYLFLNSIISEINEFYFQGVGLKHLQKNEFRDIKIPLAPFKIQEQIIAKIEDLEKQENENVVKIDTLKNEIKKIFDDKFMSEFHTEFIGNIAKVKGGKRVPKGETFSHEKTDFPYLRVSDFKNNTIEMSNLKYITKSIFEKISNYTISTKDIYISIAGTIGLVGIIPKELDGKSLTENAGKIMLEDYNPVTQKYLLEILQTDDVKKQIEERTNAVGVPKLALKRIETIKIPLPPLEEQQKIVAKIEKIEQQIAELETQLNAIPSQKEAVLKKYL